RARGLDARGPRDGDQRRGAGRRRGQGCGPRPGVRGRARRPHHRAGARPLTRPRRPASETGARRGPGMHEGRRPVRVGTPRGKPGRASRRSAGAGDAGEPCAQRALTAFAMADLRFAAWFAWMTPFETALSSLREAAWSAVVAASLSPAATASRTRRTYVLSSDLTALLRRRAFSFVRMRLIWDLMLATCGLSGSVRRSERIGRRGRLQLRDWGGEPVERGWGCARRPGRTRDQQEYQRDRSEPNRARTSSAVLGDAPHDAVEDVAAHDGALASDRVRVDPDHAVEPHLAVPALGVPRAGADVEPVAAPPRLVVRVARVVLAREHDAEEPRAVGPDEEHGAVLALRVVLLVRDPRPHDLARVRVAVELGRVLGAHRALVVARVPARAGRGPRGRAALARRRRLRARGAARRRPAAPRRTGRRGAGARGAARAAAS